MTNTNDEPTDNRKRLTAQILQACLLDLGTAVRELENKLTFTVQYPQRSPSPDECVKIVKALSTISSSTSGLMIYVASIMSNINNEGDKQ
jgi:hypothetical protein